MNRRKSHKGLTNSRIYQKRNRFYLFARDLIENPKTGKVSKWHSLCAVEDGELKARNIADAILKHASIGPVGGDLPNHVETYRLEALKRREKDRPREAARVKMFEEGSKEITRAMGVVSQAFADFNVDQVMPVDIARFVDQWLGQRMAQVYLSRLSDFFRWCVRRGLRADNPCLNVRVEKPAKRRRYITDDEWHRVRDALMVGVDGKKTQSGPMAQCYIDLCYLLYQRTTEVRLLKWTQVDFNAGMIYFTPTKTERSSGLSVGVPISPEVQAVLERVKAISMGTKSISKAGGLHSIYVIHNRRGQPYGARGIHDAWDRACERAGVEDAKLKDIRAKAATDAKRAGYSRSQIRVGLAHTDESMTEHYLRGRDASVSEILMPLPKKVG